MFLTLSGFLVAYLQKNEFLEQYSKNEIKKHSVISRKPNNKIYRKMIILNNKKIKD